MSQFTPLNNDSKIPENQTFTTNTNFSFIKFENKDIINIIRPLNVDKAHGHDNILIRMLKICDTAIVEPLSIIFNNCIDQSMFSDIWKKSIIYPIHKKDDKQIINNYRPVSLLPISGKIFQRIFFNVLFEYIEEKKLLSVRQPGFWSNETCVNQQFPIAHNLYKAFDGYPTLETHGLFLDMFKAFEKVWHQGLIFKLKSIEVSNFLLSLSES